MKAHDLKIDEIIEFSEGQISLHGRRLVLRDIHATAQLRKDMLDTVGLEHTRRMLTRSGFCWGQADAAAMARIFKWENTIEWLKAGPQMLEIQGITRTVVKACHIDEKNKHFEMKVIWHDSAEAKEHLIEADQTTDTVCWALIGYASGYASYCFKKNIYFIEQKCRGKGDYTCTAVGKDELSWGQEIQPHLKYYEKSEDIHSKIHLLTKELKRKDHELIRQHQRIKQLDNVSQGSFTEVRSESFRGILELAERVARFDSSVLITGPSGSGKEVLARHIHALSLRADESFLAVNCSALSETLLESELFGHKAGSFTGASKDRIGLFEQAQKGTVLLDEIGDVSHSVQLKLLRVLQEKEIMRVGESHIRKIDVRVIAATNRDLSKAIQEGRFREDLYYRLGVIEIEVPALNQRRDDILPLARYFIDKLAKDLKMPDLRLDGTCLDFLIEYHWPGNIRELENVLERAAILSKDEVVLPECLPTSIVHSTYRQPKDKKTILRTLDQVEHDHIQTVLEYTEDNRSKAAQILGINQSTLWRRIKRS